MSIPWMHTEVCESLCDIFRITLPNMVGSFGHEPVRVCPGCRKLAIRKQNNDASKRKIPAITKLGKQMLHFSVYFTTQLLCTAKTDSQVTMTMLQIRTFVLARSACETFAKKKRKRRPCFESDQRFCRWKIWPQCLMLKRMKGTNSERTIAKKSKRGFSCWA